MLKLERVETFYGNAQALFGVSFTVGQGEVVAIMGRNGMGKTTIIRSIIGLTPPSRGTITYHGQSLHTLPSFRIARLGIGLVPEGDARYFPPFRYGKTCSQWLPTTTTVPGPTAWSE